MIAKKKKIDLEQFIELAVDEFQNIRDEFKEVKLDIANIKLDIHEIKEEQREMNTRICGLQSQVNRLETQLENQAGYAKEIDYAFERLTRIENHLGLPPIACVED